MQRSWSRPFTSLVLVLATSASAACSSFGTNDDQPSPAPQAGNAAPGAGDADASPPKAPVVTGTPDGGELNETLGVFVTVAGRPNAAGTRMDPLASLQAGIDLGRRLGKRVYACAGTYREALVLADSISVIGGLDCSREDWRIGAARTRIEAPASPAVQADGITSATRLEGLDVVSPNAEAPSASSFGLIARESPGLSIVSSRVESGSGQKGADGTEGIQLVQTGTLNGSNGRPQMDACFGILCSKSGAPNTAGGTSICSGAAGHDGQAGGYGGTGGLYWWNYNGLEWRVYGTLRTLAELRAGGFPAVGIDGASAPAQTILSADGYTASNGSAGTDGARGTAGRGGDGLIPTIVNPPANPPGNVENPRWFGNSGAGGGAGGCPGLAGTPGMGGGASIAVLVVGAAIKIEKSDLLAHAGGAGGKGTFGSSPTPGGMPGADYAALANTRGNPGTAGAASGVSGSGAGGPSYGLAFTAASPVLVASTAKAGRGGDGLPEIAAVDALGNAKTIPASASGIAQDIQQR